MRALKLAPDAAAKRFGVGLVGALNGEQTSDDELAFLQVDERVQCQSVTSQMHGRAGLELFGF